MLRAPPPLTVYTQDSWVFFEHACTQSSSLVSTALLPILSGLVYMSRFQLLMHNFLDFIRCKLVSMATNLVSEHRRMLPSELPGLGV